MTEKLPSSPAKINAEVKQVKKELEIPSLFEHYEYIYCSGSVITTSGISELDQQQLIKLGWIKEADNIFTRVLITTPEKYGLQNKKDDINES